MRTQFVQAVARRTAIRRCPWACKIAEVDGGWLAFESVADYDTWRNQQ